MAVPFSSNLPPMNAAADINRTAAMLPAAPARRLWLRFGSKCEERSFQGVSKTDATNEFAFTIENSHLRWIILQNESRWQGVFGVGVGGGTYWDICLGVTQQSRFSFLRWWQTPRLRPFGHQRFRAVSSQTGSRSDFASARAVHSWAIQSVKHRKYVFLQTSGRSFVSCL